MSPELLTQIAWSYLYWCNQQYLRSLSGSQNAELHNVLALAHAASTQQMGFQGLLFSLPVKSIRAKMYSELTTIQPINADSVLIELGLPQPV